jgi:hypothetical protein
VVQSYLAATPPRRFLVTGMWEEWAPLAPMLRRGPARPHTHTHAPATSPDGGGAMLQAGCPWMYGVLQNFGGTLYMGMSTRVLTQGSPVSLPPPPSASAPSASASSASAPSVFASFAQHAGAVGIGAFPEGVDQNPAYFTLFFDTLWEAAPVPSLDDWWARYAVERRATPDRTAASLQAPRRMDASCADVVTGTVAPRRPRRPRGRCWATRCTASTSARTRRCVACHGVTRVTHLCIHRVAMWRLCIISAWRVSSQEGGFKREKARHVTRTMPCVASLHAASCM